MRQRIVKNPTGNCTKNMYVENVGGLNGNWDFIQIFLMSWWAEEYHLRMFFSFPQSEPSMHRISSTCALHARTHAMCAPFHAHPQNWHYLSSPEPPNKNYFCSFYVILLFLPFFLSLLTSSFFLTKLTKHSLLHLSHSYFSEELLS